MNPQVAEGSTPGVKAGGGHLFVVHGRVDAVVHDAAVVPVDRGLSFTDAWADLFGGAWPREPAGWSRGWARVANTGIWLVEVGDGAYAAVLDRLEKAVREIARQITEAGHQRELPLIAVPVLGIGHGGHHHEMGAVLAQLVDRLTECVCTLPVDVALVTPDASVYAAAQYLRRQTSQGVSAHAEQIGRLAAAGELALFLGAGASIPAGLPSWDCLINELAGAVEELDAALLKGLGPTDQAELIEAFAKREFAESVAEVTRRAERPSLVHALLAGLDVAEVVTTNYDLLYERAVAATGGTIARILPWSPVGDSPRWVLKLHGDQEHPDKIVLTRRQMVRFDAANRPSAALLQSLFLTRHVLFVGASFTDDNVIRLAHEVDAYREEHQAEDGRAAYATVLDAEKAPDTARRALWKGRLDWVSVREATGCDSYRAVEIFLDQVGMCASSSSAWLLDERFTGMLPSSDDRELAKRVRALAQEIPDAKMWRPLKDALDAMGAPTWK